MRRRAWMLGWVAAAACQGGGDAPRVAAGSGSAAHPEVGPVDEDLAGLAAGAIVVSGPTGAWKLFDDDPATVFEQQGDALLVLALSDRAAVRRVAVDVPLTLTPTQVRVEGSEDGAAWAPIVEGELPHGGALTVSGGAPARWLRVRVIGSLAGLHVTGARVTSDPPASATGSYDILGVGALRLAQAGSQVTGCTARGERIAGGFDGRVLRFQVDGHPAVMTFGAGRAWFGAWADARAPLVPAPVTVAPADAPACAPPPDAGLAGDLAATGRARLYGVVFDRESAVLREDARAELDELARVLAAQPALAIQIEAYTDGTAASNQILGAKQAVAVRQYLVAAGIDAGRLAMKSLGTTVLVAPNGSALGRAQNRRIEIVRQSS